MFICINGPSCRFKSIRSRTWYQLSVAKYDIFHSLGWLQFCCLQKEKAVHLKCLIYQLAHKTRDRSDRRMEGEAIIYTPCCALIWLCGFKECKRSSEKCVHLPFGMEFLLEIKNKIISIPFQLGIGRSFLWNQLLRWEMDSPFVGGVQVDMGQLFVRNTWTWISCTEKGLGLTANMASQLYGSASYIF